MRQSLRSLDTAPIGAPLAFRDVLLLPECGVFDPRTQTLWLADVHLGKAAAFRRAGVPVPAGTTQHNLARIAALIEAYDACRLIFLGDLVHARASWTPALAERLLAFRRAHDHVAMTLVMGNHDARAGAPAAHFDIEIAPDSYRCGAICGVHEPLNDDADIDADLVLAGHIHPAVRLASSVDRLRLPCFAHRAGQMVLPAFGEFTGGFTIDRRAYDTVVAVCGDQLRRV